MSRNLLYIGKKLGKAIFIIFMIGIIVVLFNYYRQNVSSRQFYIFSCAVGIFIILQIILHMKLKKKTMLLKIFDLLGMIILAFLIYIFFMITSGTMRDVLK